MREPRRTQLIGLALSLVGIVAVLWLAVTGGLALYIHPRYFGFTITMAAIAGVVVLGAIVVVVRAARRERAGRSAEHSDHDHAASTETRAGRTWRGIAGVAVVAAVGGALLVLPPSTLTTVLVDQRDMNASAAEADGEVELAGADTAQFTVKDWAALLRQGADATTLAGMTPTLVGFVTPDPDDPENVFFVARFTVTCCAVDAQPVGVPVHKPGWQQEHPVDSWVEVTGPFVANPSATSAELVAVAPSTVTPIEQPADPYVT